jgi:DNA replication and repair protein RecF
MAAYSKSFLGLADSSIVKHGCDFFRIDARFIQEKNVLPIIIKYHEQKKTITWDDHQIKRSASQFGKIPMVLSSPQDIEIILGGSEERRKFIDFTICNWDSNYLETLKRYNKYLEHRNAMLKEPESIDSSVMDHMQIQMNDLGNEIYKKRTDFIHEFAPSILRWYQEIAHHTDDIEIEYVSALAKDTLAQLFKASWHKDLALKRTSEGIHRDDLRLTMQGADLKKVASQGQQKSLLYAMRIAQAEIIAQKKQQSVVFLLDDFSDKLDANRMHFLQKMINTLPFVSQWFITDTSSTFFDLIENKNVIEVI